jgi:hypothetical protein
MYPDKPVMYVLLHRNNVACWILIAQIQKIENDTIDSWFMVSTVFSFSFFFFWLRFFLRDFQCHLLARYQKFNISKGGKGKAW